MYLQSLLNVSLLNKCIIVLFFFLIIVVVYKYKCCSI